MICQSSRKNKNEEQTFFILPNSTFSIRVFMDIEEVRPFWELIQDQFSTFFHCDYLAAIQKANIDGLSYRYILVFENDRVVGFIPLQIKDFDAKKQILNLQKEQQFSLRSQVSSFIKFHSLVNGNILVSGPYMYAFIPDIPKHIQWNLNQRITEYYQKHLLVTSESKVNFTLIKDIPLEENSPSSDTNYTTFSVEPVMKLPIRSQWGNINDYLADMSSKYRVRYRRALKRIQGITSKVLSYDEIVYYQEQINVLYKNVLNNVNFTLFELSKDYFSSLELHLKEKYIFKAYFQDDNLIGFYTLINNKNELHADYLGYAKEHNKSSQLYLNMLYDMVDFGITKGFELVDFGRTALEIKSSIGAVPYEMNDFIKHKYQITNIMIPKLLQILNKETEWVQRHPFKNA